MLSVTIAAVDVAESFGLSESELMRQALVSFLQEQRRQVLAEQFEVLARYRADTLAELAAKIANGDVAEHPAWEELITAENLSARLEKIDAFLRSS
jgi:hypothetical protein